MWRTANPTVAPPVVYSAVHLTEPGREKNLSSKTISLYTYSLRAIQHMSRASGSPRVSEHRYSPLLLERLAMGYATAKLIRF